MGFRRQSRELAMQMLYALDADPSVTLQALFQIFREEHPKYQERVREFAEELVSGVHAQREPIDAIIKSLSKNWALSRMPRVDLSIMRIAAYELMFLKEIPKKVSINEAIEIARTFGAKDSSAFVNGILDEIPACLKADATG